MKELQTEAWPSDFIKVSTGEKLLALGQYGYGDLEDLSKGIYFYLSARVSLYALKEKERLLHFSLWETTVSRPFCSRIHLPGEFRLTEPLGSTSWCKAPSLWALFFSFCWQPSQVNTFYISLAVVTVASGQRNTCTSLSQRLFSTVKLVNLLKVPWKGLCLGVRDMTTILKVCFIPNWVLIEAEKLTDFIGVTLNLCVLEQICTRGE